MKKGEKRKLLILLVSALIFLLLVSFLLIKMKPCTPIKNPDIKSLFPYNTNILKARNIEQIKPNEQVLNGVEVTYAYKDGSTPLNVVEAIVEIKKCIVGNSCLEDIKEEYEKAMDNIDTIKIKDKIIFFSYSKHTNTHYYVWREGNIIFFVGYGQKNNLIPLINNIIGRYSWKFKTC